MKSSSKNKSKSLIDFLLLQPVNVIICILMMICSIYLHRKAFVIHVFGVTILLLVVLHKVNLCYGKIENPFKIHERIVLIAGFLHCFVPIAGLFRSIAMYVHVGICFIVHVFHLSECYLVFNDIKMHDTNYIIILWAVNIMEFIVNLVYCFPDSVSNEMFIVPLVVVEISAQLLSSLKLKAVQKNNYSIVSSSKSASNNNNQHQHQHQQVSSQLSEYSQHSQNQEVQQRSTSSSIIITLHSIITSRISVAIICATTVGISMGITKYMFALYITGISFICIITLIHFHAHTITYLHKPTIIITSIVPPILIIIGWLSDKLIIPKYIGAIIIGITGLPISILILLKLHTLMGNHYTFYMGLLGCLIFLTSIIIYGIDFQDNRYLQSTIVSSVSFSMAVLLIDLKLVKGGRVYVNNLSESKNSSHDPSHLNSSQSNEVNHNHLIYSSHNSSSQNQPTHSNLHNLVSLSTNKNKVDHIPSTSHGSTPFE